MKIAKRMAVLFAPLVVVIALALALLDDDPAHDHRDMVLGQWVGAVYVVYALDSLVQAMYIVWTREC
jgi:hypothetical protein